MAARLLDRGRAVIVGFVSDLAVQVVLERPNRTEASLLAVLLFVLLAAAHGRLARWMRALGTLRAHVRWQRVLLDALDFAVLVGVFLVVQLALELLRASVAGVRTDALEIGVAIGALMLLVFSAIEGARSTFAVASDGGGGDLLQLIERGRAVIVGFVSRLVLRFVVEQPNALEASLAAVLVFALLLAAYGPAVRAVRAFAPLRDNASWQRVLLSMADFVLLLAIFVVVQMALRLLREVVRGAQPLLALDAAVGVYALVVTSFAVAAGVKAWTNDVATITGDADGAGLVRLADKAVAVIVGFVSAFALELIAAQPNVLQSALVVLLVFALYAAVHGPLVRWIARWPALAHNERWRRVLAEVLDFGMLLGIFLVVQLALLLVRSAAAGGGAPSPLDAFVAVAALVLVVFSVVEGVRG
jgi:hypothetical protein